MKTFSIFFCHFSLNELDLAPQAQVNTDLDPVPKGALKWSNSSCIMIHTRYFRRKTLLKPKYVPVTFFRVGLGLDPE
jgi:hypothetical protein